jgi:DNA-binding NtrC family response regulator
MAPSAALKIRSLRLVPSPVEDRAPTFVGTSPQVRELLERADRVALTDLPVVIHGESGTGKEVLVRRIHALSRRSRAPFVAENCAAIPASLFESELFGHTRGAFTGADRDRVGLFGQADGGTLFLDEIGDLGLEVQAKLLRVLEEGRVRPIGSLATRAVDVRVICATHRDLPELLRTGKFREDLYYRLSGVTLTIPPLRERPEDVTLLVNHFLDSLNREHGIRKRFTPQGLARLRGCRWQGNVRQLKSEVTRLFHFTDGDLMDAKGLVERDDVELRATERGRLLTGLAPLAEIEKEAIELALESCGGNRVQAARRLGISRSGIYGKIKAYGIEERRPALSC